MIDEAHLEFTVPDDVAGERLDRVLALLLGTKHYSRVQIADWIADGRVQIGGKVSSKPAQKVKAGERISLDIPPARDLTLEPDSSVVFPIVFEDEHLLVIDKPAGLLVHPGAGQQTGTLVNGLLHHLGDSIQRIGDAFRPGIVHRLDKETSGLMVVAKSPLAYHSLRKQLKPPRAMKRVYFGLAPNAPKKGKGSSVDPDGRSGTIDLPIGRHLRQRVKMAIVQEGGRPSRTHWKVTEHLPAAVVIEAELETGRTHQIRVHFAECKAALLGDPVYGKTPPALKPELKAAVKKFGRQALHASRLELNHPETGEVMKFESELPSDLKQLVDAFKKQ